MADFANVLKLLRLEKSLSQQELADRLGISKSSISMYERGERNPDFETLELIADFFNVDVDYLLGRTMKTTKILNPNSVDSYFLNEDARELAQFMYENPEYKVLFDTTRKVKREDIEFVKQMIDRVRGEDNETGC